MSVCFIFEHRGIVGCFILNMSQGEAASDEGILRFIMKHNLQSGNQSYLHYMHRSQKPACFLHVNVTFLYLVALWALFVRVGLCII